MNLSISTSLRKSDFSSTASLALFRRLLAKGRATRLDSREWIDFSPLEVKLNPIFTALSDCEYYTK